MDRQIRELSLNSTIKKIKDSKINNKILIKAGNTSYFVKCTVTLKVIANHPRCAVCGAAATKAFLFEKDGHYYISFFTEKNGKLVLLTKDHIIPRAQGGGDGLSNMQACCEICNRIKSDTLIENEKDMEQIVQLKKQISDQKHHIDELIYMNHNREKQIILLENDLRKLRSNCIIRFIEKYINYRERRGANNDN